MKFPGRVMWIFFIICWLGSAITALGGIMLGPFIIICVLLMILGFSVYLDQQLQHFKWEIHVTLSDLRSIWETSRLRSIWEIARAEIDFRQVGCFVAIGGGAYVLGGFAAVFLICAVFMVAGLIFGEAMKELKAAVLKEIRSALRKDEP